MVIDSQTKVWRSDGEEERNSVAGHPQITQIDSPLKLKARSRTELVMSRARRGFGRNPAKPGSKPLLSLRNLRIVRCAYLPPKISQSPCEVPINRSIGSESQAFVREATKA